MSATNTARNARIVRLRDNPAEDKPMSWRRIAAQIAKEFPEEACVAERCRNIYNRDEKGKEEPGTLFRKRQAVFSVLTKIKDDTAIHSSDPLMKVFFEGTDRLSHEAISKKIKESDECACVSHKPELSTYALWHKDDVFNIRISHVCDTR